MINMKKFEPLCIKKRKVILDTDIGPDCDDVGAIALLNHWADEFGFDISAIINCTSNRYGTACIDAICTHFNRPDVLIGEYKPEGFHVKGLKYNKDIAENFPNKYLNGEKQAWDSTALYEKVLSESEDDGVIIVTIGMLNTLWFAYERYPELFNRKVHAVIPMAAEYKTGRTYNIHCHVEAAKKFCEKYPGDVFFSGYELGVDVFTGFEIADDNDPVNKAYGLFCGELRIRKSWDLLTVMFAVFGTERNFGLTETGKIIVDNEGNNIFEASENGNHTFITATVPKSDIEKEINAILRKNQ